MHIYIYIIVNSIMKNENVRFAKGVPPPAPHGLVAQSVHRRVCGSSRVSLYSASISI